MCVGFHLCKNSGNSAPAQGSLHWAVFPGPFLWLSLNSFGTRGTRSCGGDVIIQQLLLCVPRRSGSARGQTYNQYDVVRALRTDSLVQEVDQGIVWVSGALKCSGSRKRGSTTLSSESWGRLGKGGDPWIESREAHRMAPAVSSKQHSPKVPVFVCCVLLSSSVTQLPIIIKWSLPDGCLCKTMARFLALFVKAGIGSKLSRMALPWDCFGVSLFRVY